MSKLTEVGVCILKVAFYFTMSQKENCEAKKDRRKVPKDVFVPRKNLIGKKIGRLTVLDFHHKQNRVYYYTCKCDCGNVCVKKSNYLLNRKTYPHPSCGCWHRELYIAASSTHKMTKTPEYKSWQEMRYRCLNPDNPQYFRYGGRGITVCDRWKDSFENFVADMGERPSNQHSIDRIDNNKGYSPENCRWATRKEQCNNRRSNINLTYKGETKTLKQWCELYNMKYSLVQQAYYRGHSIDYIIKKYSQI